MDENYNTIKTEKKKLISVSDAVHTALKLQCVNDPDCKTMDQVIRKLLGLPLQND